MTSFHQRIPSRNRNRQRGVGRWRPALLFILLPLLMGLTLLVMVGIPAQAQTPSPTFDLERVTAPSSPPSAAFARSSFEQNCAACHGLNGLGDGPTAASLPYSPTIFAEPRAMWSLSPAEMFHTTKFGRIERLMPPWQNQLGDDEIWQTVMYAWSLHTDPVFVAGGQSLYTQSCAACHGATGSGDGSDAQGDLPDFSNVSDAMAKSQEDWLAGWQAAHPEIGQDWTAQEQRQVLEYIRTFTYIPAWESGYRPGSGVIVGTVVQGTAGESFPSASLGGPEVKLDAYADFTLVGSFTTTVDAEGRFEFTDLATVANISYIASVEVEGILYTSPLVILSNEAAQAEATIVVYATTDEPGAIRIDRTDWIIDDQPGALLVAQFYSFGSGGDRTYVGSTVNGLSRPATVAIHIPSGAEQVTFDGGIVGGRFQQVGDLYYDTAPLIPGQGTKSIVVRYFLPYDGTSRTFSQRFLYPTTQTLLLVAELPQLAATIIPQDAQAWQPLETQEFQGRSYDIYRGDKLPATQIEIRLTGLLAANSADPRAESSAESGAVSIPTETFAPWMGWSVGGLSLLMLAGGVLWAWRSGRVRVADRPPDLRQEVDRLARRIAQLDDRHTLGQLPTDNWQQQRSQLKARLLELTHRLHTTPTE